MKYTRYDLKKDSENKTFIAIIFLILIAAFLFGTIIFKVFVKNPIGFNVDSKAKISTNKDSGKSENSLNINKTNKYIAVQGGIYQSKENAENEKVLLSKYGTPFLITEDNKLRVLLGIFTEEQGLKVMKSLDEQKIDNSKMNFELDNKDLCDVEISEIVNANIQILNKLSEKDVKAIQTEELKKWCIGLSKVDERSKNISALKEIQNYISKMPKEITKANAEENYIYLYSFLKKISKK